MTATTASGSDQQKFPWQVYGTGPANIVTLAHPDGPITIASPLGTELFVIVSPTADVALPGGVAFPRGFVTFAIRNLTPGQAADLTISGLNLSGIEDYYKYGATPVNPAAHWYNFLFGQATDGDSAVGTGMEIVGNTIVLHLKDGDRGDDDRSKNGVIFDIGGPAITVTPPELPGDYNLDRTVDAGDYIVWRKTQNATGLMPYSSADGNGDGAVGPADYNVWRVHFGQTLPGAGSEAEAAIAPPLKPVASSDVASRSSAVSFEDQATNPGVQQSNVSARTLPTEMSRVMENLLHPIYDSEPHLSRHPASNPPVNNTAQIAPMVDLIQIANTPHYSRFRSSLSAIEQPTAISLDKMSTEGDDTFSVAIENAFEEFDCKSFRSQLQFI